MFFWIFLFGCWHSGSMVRFVIAMRHRHGDGGLKPDLLTYIIIICTFAARLDSDSGGYIYGVMIKWCSLMHHLHLIGNINYIIIGQVM